MTKPNAILGVSFSHGDSSAALIIDGVLVAGAEEERFTRVKHYALFPNQSIEYCLKHAGIKPSEVKTVAIAHRPRNVWRQKLALLIGHPNLVRARKTGGWISYVKELKSIGFRWFDVTYVEHHLAHLMSARYLAGPEDMALLSFDGLGDFVSAAFAKAQGHKIEVLDRVYFPHSVGYFYTAMTQYLGFTHFGDEFKVMGLSSYGQPRYLSVMRQLIRESANFGFVINLEAFPILKSPMGFSIEKAQPRIRPFYNSSVLTQMTGVPPRKYTDSLTRVHWDLARSVQDRFEEIATHLLQYVHERVGGDSIGLAGGCAHNSVWIGKIPSLSRFKKVHVAPASNDAGIAIGAAVYAADREIAVQGEHWALLGPTGDDFPSEKNFRYPFRVDERVFEDELELIHWIVDELMQEKIVGILRGRMEFGPRALGNRSIVCDPRVPTMKDRLNERVKHRELFRPFAASVLWEHQSDWFKNSFFSPAMEAVFEVQEKVRNRIPAVVHVDNTCRIQSVIRGTQPFFWGLIEQFRRKTGVPLLLNTSFNDCEPIVASPKDALDCFANCEMDHVVIGNRVISRLLAKTALTG